MRGQLTPISLLWLVVTQKPVQSQPAETQFQATVFQGWARNQINIFSIRAKTKYKSETSHLISVYQTRRSETFYFVITLVQHRQNKGKQERLLCWCCCDESLREYLWALIYCLASWAASHSANALTQCVAPALPSIGATFGPGREFYRDDYSRH